MTDKLTMDAMLAAAATLRGDTDRGFLGFDPAPGPDRTVLVVGGSLSHDVLALTARMAPRPGVYVVPDEWLSGSALRLPDESFIVPRSAARRLEALPSVETLLGRIAAADLHYLGCDWPDPPARSRRSKGMRRHVRRRKAAGTWR
jgi:hypothetical protein